MKHNLLTSFLTLAVTMGLLSACSGSSFKIEGTLSDSLASLPEATVTLYEEDVMDDGSVLAELPVTDGKFFYKGKASTMKIYSVVISTSDSEDAKTYGVTFIPEAGTVKVNLSEDNSTVEAGEITEAFTELQSTLSDVYSSRADEVNAIYTSGDEFALDSLEKVITSEISSIYSLAYDSNLDNAVGMVSLVGLLYNVELPLEEAEELYSKASDKIQKNEYIKSAMESLRAASTTAEGGSFVDFKGQDADGKAVSLSDYVGKGQYVLTDFWASWCGPCMQAIPTVKALRDKYSSKGLVVVGVNAWEQNDGDGEECAKKMEMDYPVIFVKDEKATDAYGISAIPTLILFSPEGTILKRLTGEEGLEQTLATVFGE